MPAAATAPSPRSWAAWPGCATCTDPVSAALATKKVSKSRTRAAPAPRRPPCQGETVGAAGALHCDASYVTVLSDRLESLGLVERVPDPSDRRVRQLVLTKEGRRMRTRLITKVHSTSPAVANLDAAQRDQLLALLRLIPEGGAEQSSVEG